MTTSHRWLARLRRTATPPPPDRGTTRVLRVAVLGGASLLLACAAHTLGGGALPAPGVLLVTAIVLGLAATLATARRCRFGPLLVGLGVQQVVLHVLFDTAASVASACSAAVYTVHHGTSPLSCMPTHTMATAPMGAPGPTMWVGHALAVAATAWLLSRGEAWCWRVADRVIQVATAAPKARRPRAPARPSDPVVAGRPRTLLLSRAAPRGPPVRSV